MAMIYYVICTNYEKANWLINAMIKVCNEVSSYKIEMKHNHTIVFCDGIDDNVVRFVSIREAHKLKGKNFNEDFIITENEFRKMWLLDYDFDITMELAIRNYFENKVIDCNNCKNISMTEQKQRELNCIMPHMCAKYYERIYHNSNSKETFYLYPCKRCEQEWYINYEERKGD